MKGQVQVHVQVWVHVQVQVQVQVHVHCEGLGESAGAYLCRFILRTVEPSLQRPAWKVHVCVPSG